MKIHPSETNANKLDPLETEWMSAWAVGFVNPLVPLKKRNECEAQMLHITQNKPHVIASILTGAISMMSRLLPAEDPWRNLVKVSDNEVLLPGGYYFDSTAATDLIAPSSANWALDHFLSPLTIELDDAGKVILAAAADGWDQTLSTAERIYPMLNPSMDEAEAIWDSLTTALRWITNRYMSYTDPDQIFVKRCLGLAMEFSNAPMEQDTVKISKIDQVDPEAKIANGFYTKWLQSEY